MVHRSEPLAFVMHQRGVDGIIKRFRFAKGKESSV